MLPGKTFPTLTAITTTKFFSASMLYSDIILSSSRIFPEKNTILFIRHHTYIHSCSSYLFAWKVVYLHISIFGLRLEIHCSLFLLQSSPSMPWPKEAKRKYLWYKTLKIQNKCEVDRHSKHNNSQHTLNTSHDKIEDWRTTSKKVLTKNKNWKISANNQLDFTWLKNSLNVVSCYGVGENQ